MKKTVSLVCVVLVLVLSLSLAACGSDGSGRDFSGTYKLVEITASGQDMTSYLDRIGDVTLVIEGEKATLDFGEDTTVMIIDPKGMTISSGGTTSPFSFENNKLTMEDKKADTKMVFEKQ